MDPKHPFASRLFWVGLLTSLVGSLALIEKAFMEDPVLVQVVQEYPVIAIVVATLIGALTLALRFLTDSPISFGDDDDA